MSAYLLAIGIPAAVFIGGLAAIMLRDRRDDDPAPFNWQGTVPAAPGQCSCGAPHARKLTPFPGDPAPMLAAPVPEPAPQPVTPLDYCQTHRGRCDPAYRGPEADMPAPMPEPAPQPGVPAYVRDELNGHDNADDFLESRWRKIDGERLAEQIRDGAP